ncbi:MAG: DUF1810 domain-containing protein [Rhodobacteraceae bacterium]|nr:DUF1810 domain-containing protein [Paracoccaceae bacterium]
MPPIDPTLNNSLERFLTAQAPVYDTVLSELRAGRKTTHWMWFIFPQLRGLGRSTTADYFGLKDIAEARSYLAHETLGARLRQCSGILLTTGDKTAYQVFGSPDDLKLCSCMTLFSSLAETNSPFDEVLRKYFPNQPPAPAASGG